LTAKILFNQIYFPEVIDISKVLRLSIGIVNEIIVLENEINSLLEDEKRASEDYENSRGQKGRFFVPAVTNLETRCKTIFSKS